MSSNPVAPIGFSHLTQTIREREALLSKGYWVEFELTFFLQFHSLFWILFGLQLHFQSKEKTHIAGELLQGLLYMGKSYSDWVGESLLSEKLYNA